MPDLELPALDSSALLVLPQPVGDALHERVARQHPEQPIVQALPDRATRRAARQQPGQEAQQSEHDDHGDVEQQRVVEQRARHVVVDEQHHVGAFGVGTRLQQGDVEEDQRTLPRERTALI